MRASKDHFRSLRHVLTAGAVAFLAAGAPALAETTPVPAGAPNQTSSSYAPTTADYQGVYAALQRYRMGVEMHDQQMQDSAFWDAPKSQRPPGAPSWEEIKKMPGFVEVWHMPMDAYVHFDSATRARHFGYFLSIYPQPEKKVENPGGLPNASSARASLVGWPGYYDDILEKRNGEWRILERKIKINETRSHDGVVTAD